LVTVFYNLEVADLAKTVILAAIDAVVIFAVSMALKALVKRWHK
jgi:hypothetical protein